MRIGFEESYTRFSELLDQRFTTGVHTTEDSVRYTFFAAMMEKTTIQPHKVVLEYPHNTIAKAEVDTYICTNKESDSVIEFKYHRPIPSGANAPRPQLAGGLFKDLFRLARFEPENDAKKLNRLFIYVTAQEMNQYLSSKRNGLNGFYGMPNGEILTIDAQFVRDKSKTFVKSCGDITELSVKMEYATNLSASHHLRIWSVSTVEQ